MADFPTGVAVVTTTDLSGRPHGFTCSALCSVTVTPPTLLVCANLHGAFLAALLERGLFAVNLLAESAIPTATRFSAASSFTIAKSLFRSSGSGTLTTSFAPAQFTDGRSPKAT